MSDAQTAPTTRSPGAVHRDLAAALDDFEAKIGVANIAQAAAMEAAKIVQKFKDEAATLETDAESLWAKVKTFVEKAL